MSDDPAITAAIQSGIVPPSISAEYLAESRDRPARRAIIFVGALTIVVVLLRFISRLSVSRLGLDDALAAFSLVHSPTTRILRIRLMCGPSSFKSPSLPSPDSS
jgi:hypothetical protein